MGSGEHHLHIFVFPLMAPGHLLPAIDISKLLAIEGARVSLITTAGNAPVVEASTRRLTQSGHLIDALLIESSLSTLPLPDNLSSIKSPQKQADFLINTSSLRPSFLHLVKLHLPSAIISDAFFPWTAEISEELDIPRILFHGTSFFYLCADDKLHTINPNPENSDLVSIRGLPHSIILRKSHLPDTTKARPELIELFRRMKEAEKKSYGVVVNSFYELEPEYADHYRKVMGKKAWHIGPAFLRSGNDTDIDTDSNWENIVNWLDSKSPGSVLYVCFGSSPRISKRQEREIAVGLESSGYPFVWVMMNMGEEELEESVRISDMGLVIRAWAPQVMILNHWAVGGFMTHCGWNSSLESIAAGLPAATWPMFGDQFLNERFLVDVLKIGVEVGVKSYTLRGEEGELITGEEIAAAVGRLMGDEEEAEERRRRAREMKVVARRAVEEGGSSREDLRRLILELSEKMRE